MNYYQSKESQYSMDQVQLQRLVSVAANGDLQLKVQLPGAPAQQR